MPILTRNPTRPRRSWPGLLARTGAVALAGFLALFALDAGLSIGLLIHLLPALAVLAGGLIGWKAPGLGALWFLVLGLTSIPFFDTFAAPSVLLAVTMPLLLLAGLFAADSWHRRSTPRGTPGVA